MKKIIIFLMIFSFQSLFAQWEKTNWKSDPVTGTVFPFGDTIVIVEDKALISTDKGKSWESFFKESEEIPFSSIIISKNNIFLSSEYDGLLYSSDFGKTWEERNSEPFVKYAPMLYLNGDFLWSTSSGGVYLSSDFGKSWILKINGLPNSDYYYINTIAFNGDQIFLGTFRGVYISSDMGENWIFKNEGLPEYSNVSYFVFNKSGCIFIILPNTEGYNRFFVSNENDNKWIEKDNNIVNHYYSINYTSIQDTIFIQAGENFYMSADFGDNWNKLNKFEDEFWEVYDFKSSGSDLYVIISGVLYKSTDLGDTWVDLKPKINKFGMVNSMAIFKDRLIVASDRYLSYLNPPCLYSSTNFGDSWIQSCPENIYDSSVYIYMSNMAVYRDNIFFNSNAGFFKSTDIEESWEKIEPVKYFYASSLSFSGDTLFTSGGWDKIYMSPDLGTTWQQLDSITFSNTLKLKSTEYLHNNLFALMEDTDDYSRSDSIFKSSDLGKTWVSVNNGLPEKADFNLLYAFKNNLYLSVRRSGVSTVEGMYFSSDFGETWEQRNNGLPLYSEIYKFYGVGNTIFALISPGDKNPGGVYTTTDEGLNWHRQSEGFTNMGIFNFANNDEYIFVGTNTGYTGANGDVIYKAKLSDLGITNVKELKKEELSIYPNPAYDYITIKISEYTQIKIIDILGIEVLSLSPTGLLPNDELRINISHLQSGMYFIKYGNEIEKFIKL